MSEDVEEVCPLCQRPVPTTSGHHLIPKSKGGRETAEICLDCHRMIHTLFDNRRLERELSSVEALQAQPEFAKYLRWIRKRPGTTRYQAQKPCARRRHTRCRKRID